MRSALETTNLILSGRRIAAVVELPNDLNLGVRTDGFMTLSTSDPEHIAVLFIRGRFPDDIRATTRNGIDYTNSLPPKEWYTAVALHNTAHWVGTHISLRHDDDFKNRVDTLEKEAQDRLIALRRQSFHNNTSR